MSENFEFVKYEADFVKEMQEVESIVDPGATFPASPFLRRSGQATIVEYARLFGREFGELLAILCRRYGDSGVTIVGLEPDYRNYLDPYGSAPAFRVMAEDLPDGYSDGLAWEPGRQIGGALSYTVDKCVIFGSSARWSVWGQRDWEIAVIDTPDPLRANEIAHVPLFHGEFDLSSIRSPIGWGLELSPSDIAEFWRNMQNPR